MVHISAVSVVTTLAKWSQKYLVLAADEKCSFIAFVWSAGSLLFQVWLLSSRLSGQKKPQQEVGVWLILSVSLCYLSGCLTSLNKGYMIWFCEQFRLIF